jgi:hypothetical protein
MMKNWSANENTGNKEGKDNSEYNSSEKKIAVDDTRRNLDKRVRDNKRKRKQEVTETFAVAAPLIPSLQDLVRIDEHQILQMAFTLTEEDKLLYTVKGPKLLKLLAEDSINHLSKNLKEEISDLSEFCETVLNFMVVLRKQCPICKKFHERIVDRMTPCTDNECMTFFMEHGMGRNILADICYETEVVELLICIAYWATDERPEIREANFNHFPARFIQNTGESSVKQFDNIREALNRLPAVSVMKEMIDSGLFDSYMNDDPYNNESFYLLQWIINSNRIQVKYRSYESQTEEEKVISEKGRYRLFQIKNSPERESKFETEKEKLGFPPTEITYHGSKASSWHSIIRNSLKTLSGSSREVNGAFFGPGIYMSSSFYGASSYAKEATVNWPQKTLPIRRCVLVLELLRSDSLRKDIKGHIRVETNEDHVIPRYLLCD